MGWGLVPKGDLFHQNGYPTLPPLINIVQEDRYISASTRVHSKRYTKHLTISGDIHTNTVGCSLDFHYNLVEWTGLRLPMEWRIAFQAEQYFSMGVQAHDLWNHIPQLEVCLLALENSLCPRLRVGWVGYRKSWNAVCWLPHAKSVGYQTTK